MFADCMIQTNLKNPQEEARDSLLYRSDKSIKKKNCTSKKFYPHS